MNRFSATILCSLLCALLIWLGVTTGLATARADLPTTTSATSAPAATQVSAATTTAPDAQPSALDTMPVRLTPSGTFGHTPLMPRAYMVLLSRSMFVRGHMADPSHVIVPGSQRRDNTAPSLLREETNLVFNGVTKTKTSIDALVEDTSTGGILTVRPGDAVARGKVGKITLDTLEYVNGSRVTVVHIGQNFTGTDGDVSSSPATSMPSSSGASPEDILERLRQKRLQELGGGK
jgi:hypothetical protein